MKYIFIIFSFFSLAAIPSMAFADEISNGRIITVIEAGPFRGVFDFTLSIVNFAAIGILIFAALATILRWNVDTYAIKKALPALVLGIILANFSLLIAKIVIEAGDILYISFTGGDKSILVNSLSLENIRGLKNEASRDINWWVEAIGAMLKIVAFIMVFILSVLLFVRNYVIYFLVGLAPLAFFSMGIPMLQRGFQMWWGQFWRWVLMAPIAVFWLRIGVLFVQGGLGIRIEGTEVDVFDLGAYFLMLAAVYLALRTPFMLGGEIMGKWAGALGKVWGTTRGLGKGIYKYATPKGSLPERLRAAWGTRMEAREKAIKDIALTGKYLGENVPPSYGVKLSQLIAGRAAISNQAMKDMSEANQSRNFSDILQNIQESQGKYELNNGEIEVIRRAIPSRLFNFKLSPEDLENHPDLPKKLQKIAPDALGHLKANVQQISFWSNRAGEGGSSARTAIEQLKNNPEEYLMEGSGVSPLPSNANNQALQQVAGFSNYDELKSQLNQSQLEHLRQNITTIEQENNQRREGAERELEALIRQEQPELQPHLNTILNAAREGKDVRQISQDIQETDPALSIYKPTLRTEFNRLVPQIHQQAQAARNLAEARVDQEFDAEISVGIHLAGAVLQGKVEGKNTDDVRQIINENINQINNIGQETDFKTMRARVNSLAPNITAVGANDIEKRANLNKQLQDLSRGLQHIQKSDRAIQGLIKNGDIQDIERLIREDVRKEARDAAIPSGRGQPPMPPAGQAGGGPGRGEFTGREPPLTPPE